MEALRVLLVEDNQELRGIIGDCLRQQEDIEIVGEANTGAEGLRILEETLVDVMLLDIVMPQMDGFTMLEELRRRDDLNNKPQVVVLTALSRDDFILRAVDMGVAYYMVKPVEPHQVLQRIREAGGHYQRQIEQPTLYYTPRAQSLDEKLSSLFLTMGIPAHIKGYSFLREAVKIVVEEPDVINRITKELYPRIARRYSTTSSKVERAIRHAIEVAWNRGRIETLNRVFGCKVATKEDKPTNGEFIAMLADKMSLEMSA